MTPTDEELLALADYDAGLLNDFGGGDVNWWMDYLRAEIGRANDYWRDALHAIVAEPQAIRDRALEDAARVADHYAEADYCAMNYPEEGGIAASGTADMIRREIRVMKGKPE